MGQYKVPQDVESEDKILGPLTFKQFIYALVGFGWAIVCFGVFQKIPVVMILLGLPPTTLFLLLAFYRRDGQNFEQLLIAMVGFFGNDRKRLWRKDDVAETFHIEPHKIIKEQSQRNPVEVRSELERLATMIDARGWNQTPVPAAEVISPIGYNAGDRLVAPDSTPANSNLPQPQASEDMLDLQHSPLAQNLASLIETAAADVREEAIGQMKARQTAAQRQAATAAATPAQSISGVTATNPNDIMRLATERDDLTVSQLAATATRNAPLQEGQSVSVRANGQ